MKYTINETFCHIQREGNWQVGNEYLIGLEENNLTKQLETEKKIYAQGSLHEYEQNEIKQKAEYFSSYHMFVRETVFEDIRLKCFPELPSRRHGIWLCKEGNNLNYWKTKLGNQGTTFEVQVTGKLHVVCAKNLSSEGSVLSRALYSEQAFKYWSGHIHSEESVEYLFIGQLKVIAEK